ncbi:unnamed protein product, partial [Phaeothamnion confervicola]
RADAIVAAREGARVSRRTLRRLRQYRTKAIRWIRGAVNRWRQSHGWDNVGSVHTSRLGGIGNNSGSGGGQVSGGGGGGGGMFGRLDGGASAIGKWLPHGGGNKNGSNIG